MRVSIIIPVFNEERTIRKCQASLEGLTSQPFEILVVDGGSSDATVAIASEFNCNILQAPIKGRAHQQDFGARAAKGEILVFLHADTLPNPNTIPIIEQALADRSVVLGGFRSIMKGEKTRRVISLHNYLKTYYAPFLFSTYRTMFKGLRLLFGDQVMFCRKSDYLEAGGFDLEQEVMEEAAFCVRMNQLGKIIQLNDKVYSSDRRVREWGVLKAHFLYIIICTGWGWGVSSKKLAKLYPDVR